LKHVTKQAPELQGADSINRVSSLKIAYIVSRFPHLPESFILREIDALEAHGSEVVLCPLVRHRERVSHPEARRWIEQAWYTPFISPAIARDLLGELGRNPARAGRTLIEPVARVATTPNFLVGTLGIVPKAFHLARRLKTNGVDHIHAHFATHPAMAAWIIHRLTGISYSFTAHAHDIYVHTAMLPQKMADARFVVAISEYNRALLGRFGDVSKVHVIHCGVNLECYPLQQEPPPEPFTMVSVASLQPYKGLEYLIRACGLLRDRQIGPFRCRIAGGGELRESLQQLIDQLQLQDCVELLGPQTQDTVAALLQTAHLFVLPSIKTPSGKMEGLPVVLMEALAVGLPTIATEISGIPEIIRPGETGQLVPPADPAALADAIAKVIADPARAREAGRRGRRLVEAEFSLEQNVQALRQLFEATVTAQRL
jgi:colanic acid/amylovoran biosynthesis glycosyltransferase